MSLEGKIHILLNAGSEPSITISSSRPRQVCELLQGLEPDQLLQKLPLLYSLCGKAQGLAAKQALIAANSQQLVTPAERRWVVIEALQEYWWRFLIDLPQRLGQQPALAVMAPVRKLLTQLAEVSLDSDEQSLLLQQLDRALTSDLLGMPIEPWLAQDLTEMDRWLADSSTYLPRWLGVLDQQLQCLPAVKSAGQLLTALPSEAELLSLASSLVEQPQFAFEPHWLQLHPETGALSDQQQHPWLQQLSQQQRSPVLVRMLARLFELLKLTRWLALPACDYAAVMGGAVPVDDNVGLGWVKTARGLLVHRVELVQGRVMDYRILAPTEWNFHPRGPLYQGLENWQAVASEQLSDWVGWQVLALDPCVQYQFEVRAKI